MGPARARVDDRRAPRARRYRGGLPGSRHGNGPTRLSSSREMVVVGGHRLHIDCVGQGSPTVILESGLGTMSVDWANVQPEVAKTTRVCAYDRAGTGWSEPGPEPRDPQQIARELHTLLGNAGIDGPYVLVGQSFGGLYVRMYAAQYPKEVEGMVLVDASHPGHVDPPPAGSGGDAQTAHLAGKRHDLPDAARCLPLDRWRYGRVRVTRAAM